MRMISFFLRHLAVMIVMVLMALPAHAQLSVSLSEAVQLAQTQNREVKIALLEEARSVQRKREVLSNLLPQISVQGNYTRNTQNPVFFLPATLFSALDPTAPPAEPGALVAVPAGLPNNVSLSASASVPLYQPETWIAMQTADMLIEQSTIETLERQQRKRRDAIRAYCDVLLAEESWSVLQETAKRSEQALRDTRSLFARDMATQADTLRAFVNLEMLKPQFTKQKALIQSARLQLALVLGVKSDVPLVLTSSLEMASHDAYSRLKGISASAVEQDAQHAVQHRADMRRAELQTMLAEQDYAQQSAAHLPTLSAIGQWQTLTQSDNFRFGNYNWVGISSVGLQLSVPIFTGFRISARTQMAEIAITQTKEQYALQEQVMRTEIHLAHANIAEITERISMQERITRAAQAGYQAVLSRYAQGLMKQIEVQDALLALTQSTMNTKQAYYDAVIAEAEYVYSTGGK